MKEYQINVIAGTKVIADMVEAVKDATFDAITEIEPVPPGPLPVLPEGSQKKMEVGAGVWTWKGIILKNPLGGDGVPQGYEGVFWFNNTDWILNRMQQLPNTPVVNDFGVSTTNAISQKKVTELKDSVNPTLKEIRRSKNLLKPSFIMYNTVVGSTGNVITNVTTYPNGVTIGFPVADHIGETVWVRGVTPNNGKYTIYKNPNNASIGTVAPMGVNPKAFIPPAGADMLYLYIRLNTDSSPLPQIMINVGEESLEYEPYFEPVYAVEKLGEKEIISNSLKSGNKIPASSNPEGAVNRLEMEAYMDDHPGGEPYDQPLNKSDNVDFNSIGAGQITTSVLVANLPTNEADVESNEVWIDTSSGNVLKVKA